MQVPCPDCGSVSSGCCHYTRDLDLQNCSERGVPGLYFCLFLLRSRCNTLAISPVCELYSEPGFALHFGQRNRSGSRPFPMTTLLHNGVLSHGPGPREEVPALVDRKVHRGGSFGRRHAATTIWTAGGAATWVGYRDRHTPGGGDG